MSYAELLLTELNPLPKAFLDSGLELKSSKHAVHNDGARFLVLVFANNTTNVSLRISISLDNGSICSTLNRNNSSFSEEEYLSYKKRRSEYLSNFFSLGAKQYIENLCSLIHREWGEIITGNKWVDIPRDWMGYK